MHLSKLIFSVGMVGGLVALVGVAYAVPITILDYPGATWTTVTAVSGNNIIGQYMDSGGKSHSYLYEGTHWTTLNCPGAATTTTTAVAISGNNIIGSSSAGCWLYNGSTWTTLTYPNSPGTLYPTTVKSVTAISGNRIVGWLGYAFPPNHPDASSYYGGFMYDGTTWRGLPGLPTDIEGNTTVGYLGSPLQGHESDSTPGFMYDGTTLTTFPAIANYGAHPPLYVSNNHVAGTYYPPGWPSMGGFFYDGTAFKQVSGNNTYPPSVYASTSITGLSGNLAVGSYSEIITGNSQPFMYNGSTCIPLSDLGPWASVPRPRDIDGTTIVGNYNNHGFMITIPEPTTLTLLALAGLVLITGRR